MLFRILDTLRIFDLPFVLVGPNKESVETLSILAYLEANQTRYGPAAAYATMLFLYVAVVAFVFVKLLGADVIGDAVQKKKKKNGKRPSTVRRRESPWPVLPARVVRGGV